jgi:hypothetical protein
VARQHSGRTLRELAQLAGGMECPAVTMAIRRLGRPIGVRQRACQDAAPLEIVTS